MYVNVNKVDLKSPDTAMEKVKNMFCLTLLIGASMATVLVFPLLLRLTEPTKLRKI